jgi:phage tail-like protein
MTPDNRWLVDQLPRALSEDHFVQRFLSVFEDLASSVRSRIVGFDNYLDAAIAPPEFVRWMAAWLDVPIDVSLPVDRQRAFVAAAGEFLPLRGTRAALQGLLESLTGSAVKITDGGGVWREGAAPARNAQVKVAIKNAGGVNEQQLLELVAREMPANVPFELTIGRRRVRPTVDDDDDAIPTESESTPDEQAKG